MSECKCGSEPKPGTSPYLVLRFSDVASPRQLRAYGALIRVPISPQSPVFLASAREFCAAPPTASHASTGGFDKLLNDAIDRLWRRSCRCKREVAVRNFIYQIQHKVITAENPVPTDTIMQGQAFIVDPVVSVTFEEVPGFGGMTYRPVIVSGDPPYVQQLAGIFKYEYSQPKPQVISFEQVSFSCPDSGSAPPSGVEPPIPPPVLPAPWLYLPPIPVGIDPPPDPEKKVIPIPPPPPDECCDCC